MVNLGDFQLQVWVAWVSASARRHAGQQSWQRSVRSPIAQWALPLTQWGSSARLCSASSSVKWRQHFLSAEGGPDPLPLVKQEEELSAAQRPQNHAGNCEEGGP